MIETRKRLDHLKLNLYIDMIEYFKVISANEDVDKWMTDANSLRLKSKLGDVGAFMLLASISYDVKISTLRHFLTYDILSELNDEAIDFFHEHRSPFHFWQA